MPNNATSPRRVARVPVLGAGWGFPVGFIQEPGAPPGRLAMATDEESVRQSILIILSTAKGERLMRPDFGCGLHEYVFTTL
jgi:hypothetical protein